VACERQPDGGLDFPDRFRLRPPHFFGLNLVYWGTGNAAADFYSTLSD
jgi:hypothetical protein